MAKTKVTVNFQIEEDIKGFLDDKTVDRVGSTIVRDAKEMIARGQSPVEGYGPFVPYSNPKSYPGSRKPASPVNLELTREMLAGFSHRRGNQNAIEIGMVKGSAEAKKRAGYHNEGEGNNPQRRFIPGNGESFVQPIMQRAMRILDERFGELIRQSNKKK